MKSIRTTTLVMSILLAAAAGMTAAQEATQAVQDTSRLTEFGERRANEIQPPNLVMDILGIRPGMVIGEVGAGRGRVTVHLAVRVGEKGKVYANDIDPRAIESLEKRCRRLGLANVETILSLPDDLQILDIRKQRVQAFSYDRMVLDDNDPRLFFHMSPP